MKKIENTFDTRLQIEISEYNPMNENLFEQVRNLHVEEWMEMNRLDNTLVYGSTKLTPLKSCLEKPMGAYDFYMILGQFAKTLAILKQLGLKENDILWNLDYIYMSSVTRELKFIYCPDQQSELNNFVEKLVYLWIPSHPEDTYVSKFVFYFKKHEFSIRNLIEYISMENNEVSNILGLEDPIHYNLEKPIVREDFEELDFLELEKLNQEMHDEQELVEEDIPYVDLQELEKEMQEIEEDISLENKDNLDILDLMDSELNFKKEDNFADFVDENFEFEEEENLEKDEILQNSTYIASVEKVFAKDEDTFVETVYMNDEEDVESIYDKTVVMDEENDFGTAKMDESIYDTVKMDEEEEYADAFFSDNQDKTVNMDEDIISPTMLMEDDAYDDRTVIMDAEASDERTMVMDEPIVPQEVLPKLVLTRLSNQEVIVVSRDEFTIGKSEYVSGYTVRGNGAISRKHCIIRKKGNKFYLMDLGSSNGTFISENRIEPNKEIKIFNGDIIKLGDEDFKAEIIK